MRVQRLIEQDASTYRELRLEALRERPDAFGASFESEAAQSLEWFAERLRANTVFGAHQSNRLIGTIGLHVLPNPKQQHKGIVWGMYVRPEGRGTGIGSALLARLIQEAESIVEELRLSVVTTNTDAKRLYEQAGFEPYGLEPRSLKVGSAYHDEVLMALALPSSQSA